MGSPDRRRPYGALAGHLEALASETRLELLHALRAPKGLQEIRVGGTQTRGDMNPDRPISRQAVTRHLDQLVALGLVRRVAGAADHGGDAFVLNHEALFAIVDEMRTLAKLRPFLNAEAQPGVTVSREAGEGPSLPPGPRLLLVYGRDDGVSFPLAGPEGARWRIGRGPACECRLEYDPFASAEHAVVAKGRDGFTLTDLGSRNGTWRNWLRLERRASVPLAAGDIITVGRSTLVLQPG